MQTPVVKNFSQCQRWATEYRQGWRIFEETDFSKEENTKFLNHPFHLHCLEQILLL